MDWTEMNGMHSCLDEAPSKGMSECMKWNDNDMNVTGMNSNEAESSKMKLHEVNEVDE